MGRSGAAPLQDECADPTCNGGPWGIQEWVRTNVGGIVETENWVPRSLRYSTRAARASGRDDNSWARRWIAVRAFRVKPTAKELA